MASTNFRFEDTIGKLCIFEDHVMDLKALKRIEVIELGRDGHVSFRFSNVENEEELHGRFGEVIFEKVYEGTKVTVYSGF